MRERLNTNYIELRSGRKFWPLNPVWEDVDILDIAHSLANKCRYTGHTREFYSVAQHSVLVSTFVPEPYALEGLLHDAAEAYLPDLAFPLRGAFAEWDEIEHGVHQAVAKRFGLEYPFPESLRHVDRKITRDEAWCLMHTQGLDWPGGRERFGITIRPWGHREAKERFIERYEEILRSGRDVNDPWHFKAIIRERRNK